MRKFHFFFVFSHTRCDVQFVGASWYWITCWDQIKHGIEATIMRGNRSIWSLKNMFLNHDLKIKVKRSFQCLWSCRKWIADPNNKIISVTRKKDSVLCMNREEEKNQRKMGTNQKFYLNSSTFYKENLSWLGHVQKKENRIPKITILEAPGENRKRGRSRMRWQEDMEADLKKQTTINKTKWS